MRTFQLICVAAVAVSACQRDEVCRIHSESLQGWSEPTPTGEVAADRVTAWQGEFETRWSIEDGARNGIDSFVVDVNRGSQPPTWVERTLETIRRPVFAEDLVTSEHGCSSGFILPFTLTIQWGNEPPYNLETVILENNAPDDGVDGAVQTVDQAVATTTLHHDLSPGWLTDVTDSELTGWTRFDVGLGQDRLQLSALGPDGDEPLVSATRSSAD